MLEHVAHPMLPLYLQAGRRMTNRSIDVAIVLVLIALLSSVAAAQQPTRPADYVFIVMLDGMRPDLLRLAEAPNIARLAASGTRYMQARTIYPSQTRVAFVSLPTGAYPASHGIVGGDFFMDSSWKSVSLGREPDPFPAQELSKRATLFDELSAAGRTSLYAAMKGYELVGAHGATWTINGNLTLDRVAYATRYDPQVNGSAALALWYKELLSRQLLDQALAIIKDKQPNLVILNLGSADYVAHSFGPQSPPYREAIAFVDGLVGDLVKALDTLKLGDRSAIVISADHGFTHGDGHTLAAPQAQGVPQIPALTARGIEHAVTNTGGTSMGIYVRDKGRIADAATALRAQPWTDAIYCEEVAAHCDKSLHELKAYFGGRSPDLMVDLDDEATIDRPFVGNHGSLRDTDMQIPLILSGAGVSRGVVAGKAEIVDIAPTVLRLLGIDAHTMRPDGRVLTEALARDLN